MTISKWIPSILAVAAAGAPLAHASEQSDAKGFIEDSKLNLLIRNSYWNRDFNRGKADQKMWAQAFFGQFESGFTQGLVGFGVDAFAKDAFKLDGGDGTAGNHTMGGFFAAKNTPNSKGVLPPVHSYSYAGGAVKARFSNTVIKYGDIMPQLPVLSYDTSRLLPGSFSGAMVTSKEIQGLELNAGHFTAETGSDYSSRDPRHLKSVNVLGGSYHASDDLSFSLYASDIQDVAKKKYVDATYILPLANEQSLTSALVAYRTHYDKQYVQAYTASDDSPGVRESRDNTIYNLSEKYSFGAHAVTLSYQQNSGNEGYQYDIGDGGGTIYVANSYYSDFNAKHEKSLQLAYDLDFARYGIPGLTWRSAYVYGWDIDTSNGAIKTASTDTSADERELMNQVKYVFQSGPAKNLTLRARNSIYHTDKSYGSNLIEWRLFIDYPLEIL